MEDYSKIIYLVKHEAHYTGLRGMISFLNRSYFCPECCKGYDMENAAHHNCLDAIVQVVNEQVLWKEKEVVQILNLEK